VDEERALLLHPELDFTLDLLADRIVADGAARQVDRLFDLVTDPRPSRGLVVGAPGKSRRITRGKSDAAASVCCRSRISVLIDSLPSE
jgi:hypothetical protein